MDTFNDKTLNCADCGGEFLFSKNEQAFYAERGFTNEPKRCKNCRDKRKTAREGNGGSRERSMVSVTCDSCNFSTGLTRRARASPTGTGTKKSKSNTSSTPRFSTNPLPRCYGI